MVPPPLLGRYSDGTVGEPAASHRHASPMAMFTPRNQLQNMLDAEIGQALCGRPNIGRIVALDSMLRNHAQQQPTHHVPDSWLDDNWNSDY